MDFFEEITRHKLLQGFLPMEIVYAPEELDTLMAAYMAWRVINCPQETILVGDAEEGRIALPVASLKEKYS
jgi:predicted RNase H-like nuclease